MNIINRIHRGILGAVAWLIPVIATAGTIQVPDYHDFVDDNDGSCTLREAIRSANSGVDVDACQHLGQGVPIIELLAGTYSLDLSNGTGEDLAVDGDLDVRVELVINGLSAETTIIDGDAVTSVERVLDVHAFTTVTNLTIQGGRELADNGGNIRGQAGLSIDNVIVRDGEAGNGGGLFANGPTTGSNSRFEGNRAAAADGFGGGIYLSNIDQFIGAGLTVVGNTAGAGGGIYATGSRVDLDNSVIRDNEALSNNGCGGGLAVASEVLGSLIVTRTLIANNRATRGGGVCWRGAPPSEITHSAIIDNEATENGGGIWADADGFVRYTTISGNTASAGGGVYSAAPMQFLFDAVTLASNRGGGGFHNESGGGAEFSLFADNVGGNCVGSTMGAGAYNLDDANTCGFPTTDPNLPSLINTDPVLGPLQDNGGQLPTHALLQGSPAIDAYSSAERKTCPGVPDQRIYPRGNPPVSGDGSDDDHLCDIGAYERSPPYIVDTTDDTADANLADGVCADNNGACSLRAAIMQSNSVPYTNEIILGAATYSLTLAGAGEDMGATGDLDIREGLRLIGQGVNLTIIDGAALDRVLHSTVPIVTMNQPEAIRTEISDLTITGGAADNGGGFLAENSEWQLTRVTVRDNNVTGDGGGIYCTSSCALTLTDSTVSGNSANSNGAGLYHNAEQRVLVEGTSFTGNTGGIGVGAEALSIHAINSTFSGNQGGSSGALFASEAILENVTAVNNEVTGDTGGLFILNRAALVNTIIANNRLNGVVDENCTVSPKAISLGHNLSDTDAADCGLSATTDLIDTDPFIGPLADNGGPTQTHDLLAGSPAIDAGDNGRCLAMDQRGFSRPADGDGDGSAICDIGAVEVVSADVAISATATPNPVTVGNNVTFTINVANSGPGAAASVAATLTVPTGMTLVSAQTGGADCAVMNDVVTCELGTLASGGNATAAILATADQQGGITASLAVTTISVDGASGNDNVDVTIAVNAAGSGGGGTGGGSGGGSGGGGAIGVLGCLLLLIAATRKRCVPYFVLRRHGGSRLLLLAITLVFSAAHADPVVDLVSFSANTRALASEVNANFSTVASSVNDNDSRIAMLEADNASLRAEVADLKVALGSLLNISQFLSLETLNEQPAIRVTGANLQLVNGLGATATANGTGNLIVGYDEERDSSVSEQCSVGTNPGDGSRVTNLTECTAAGGVFARNHKTGSHYVIAGIEANYSRWGGLVVGHQNTSNYDYASVSGGRLNRASGQSSSVSGGVGNTASGTHSSVSGGQHNTASGAVSSVSGGSSNTANGVLASISGGNSNTASGNHSSVSGGSDNTASGFASSISAGRDNIVNGDASSITGGRDNIVNGGSSSVGGGRNNTANGSSAAVSGGVGNSVSGDASSISGGSSNAANGDAASISGGNSNTASGNSSSVSGGRSRTTTGEFDWAAGSLSEDQ